MAGHKPSRHFRFAARWVPVVVGRVTYQTSRDFGFLRSRWCCEADVLLMLRVRRVEVSRETVRRRLHRRDLVCRRPRPTLWPKDTERQARRTSLHKLLAERPAATTVAFQDEVDINTNPKIGSMWMVRGQQAEVEMQDNHEKRYISGSIHWRTSQTFSPMAGRSGGETQRCSRPTWTSCSIGFAAIGRSM